MPYKLVKTDGTVLTTVQDATIDNTTSLTFVGRNYSGYGQPIEENFVFLLENFANNTQPLRPVEGQLWFDNSNGVNRLKVCYNGTDFRPVYNIPVSPTNPSNPEIGDIWWDTNNDQLKVYTSNGNWTASSPFGGKSSSWNFDKVLDTSGELRSAIKGLSGYSVMCVISNTGTYTPTTTTNVSPAVFPTIKAGIVLPYANRVTGKSASSTSSGYLLWGTAADALSSQKSEILPNTSTGTFYIPFVGTYTLGSQQMQTTSSFSFNAGTGVLNVIASSALYADLAERYEADQPYQPGTVVVIGGTKEVTVTDLRADTRVAGIISTNPAYTMNSLAGSDETHPFVALKGRVPCKVFGPVNKGDLLVTSSQLGHAEVYQTSDMPAAVIAKSLGINDQGFGTVEVLVV